MASRVFSPGEILLPSKGVQMPKWSVVACDQYTSEPEYWNRVAAFVGDAPSTLKLTLPEIYLEDASSKDMISDINRAMTEYLSSGVFEGPRQSYIYVERTQRDGKVRRGLMGVVDLEEYEYLPGSQSKIRATEGTVLERIPPRVKVRENAPLELPHIMLLIDDDKKTVIEPLTKACESFETAYDFELMENSGSIRGFFVPETEAEKVDAALLKLADINAFEEKYSVNGKGVLQFAVGDGNHSLATAKECWNRTKKNLSPELIDTHPARFALCELVNLHDEALEFEPIHRVVFDVNPEKLYTALSEYYELSEDAEQTFEMVTSNGTKKVGIKDPKSNLTVGSLQKFIDEYLKGNGGRVDYIHGDEVVKRLGAETNNVGFLLPGISKASLFPTVIRDGVLPRKAFSMGHAWDKRFYLESRKIK